MSVVCNSESNFFHETIKYLFTIVLLWYRFISKKFVLRFDPWFYKIKSSTIIIGRNCLYKIGLALKNREVVDFCNFSALCCVTIWRTKSRTFEIQRTKVIPWVGQRALFGITVFSETQLWNQLSYFLNNNEHAYHSNENYGIYMRVGFRILNVKLFCLTNTFCKCP